MTEYSPAWMQVKQACNRIYGNMFYCDDNTYLGEDFLHYRFNNNLPRMLDTLCSHLFVFGPTTDDIEEDIEIVKHGFTQLHQNGFIEERYEPRKAIKSSGF